jgi:hypothetical protein
VSDAPPDSPLAYRLEPRVIARRAWITALVRAASAAAPAVLVIVLALRTRVAPPRAGALAAAVVLALGLVRTLLVVTRSRRNLASLVVRVDGRVLDVTTRTGQMRIEPAELTRVVDVGGALGGLRLEIDARAPNAPAVLEVPRGGPGFVELRARIAAMRPIEPGRRRGPLGRLVFVALVVGGLFFVPFAVDDLTGNARAVVLVAAAALAVGVALGVARR